MAFDKRLEVGQYIRSMTKQPERMFRSSQGTMLTYASLFLNTLIQTECILHTRTLGMSISEYLPASVIERSYAKKAASL